MDGQILDYFGNAHSGYIHAGGKLSTNKLFELLEPKQGENILEIGFGTGTTVVQFAANSKAQFFGYELSPLMYHKALRRTKHCKAGQNIELTLLQKKNQFPAADNTFDKVYVESMIAIQEGSSFEELIKEINRVLKPNGILVFNETIWLDSTSKERAVQFNLACKAAFGIIQSNDEHMFLSNWKKALEGIGFQVETEIHIDSLQLPKRWPVKTVFRSELFTLSGKMKASISPSMRRKWKVFNQRMAEITNNERLMEGVIIKATNRKQL